MFKLSVINKILLIGYVFFAIISLTFSNDVLFIGLSIVFVLYPFIGIWTSNIEKEKMYLIIPLYSLSTPISGILVLMCVDLFSEITKMWALSIIIVVPLVVLVSQLILIWFRTKKSEKPLLMLNKVKVSSGYSIPIYGILLFLFTSLGVFSEDSLGLYAISSFILLVGLYRGVIDHFIFNIDLSNGKYK